MTDRAPDITLADLRRYHRIAAEMVIMDRVYLPIFLRLERELAARDEEAAALDRARQITQNASG